MPNGKIQNIRFAAVVIAAGASSQEIAEKAEIGLGKGILSVPLPVERRYIMQASLEILDISSFCIFLGKDMFTVSIVQMDLV